MSTAGAPPDRATLDSIVSRFTQMRGIAARAESESSGDSRAMFNAYRAYLLSGDYAGAYRAIGIACRLEPANTHVLQERGALEEYLGQAEAAAASYEAALRVEPLNYKAAYGLASVRKQTSADIDRLKAAFELRDSEGWRSLHIGHALAKAYEDAGDIEASFAWLEKAKQQRRAMRAYDAAFEARLADALCATPHQRATFGYTSPEPIFVSGLPRSGTTLVERILASHPNVSAAGEIGNFAMLHKVFSGAAITMDPVSLAQPPTFDFCSLGEAYIASTRPLTGAKPRFVDKAPSNYLLADRILRALPEARVICLRRHPLDSVLSNYKQIFPIDDRFYDYVYALESAAHKFLQFDRVLRHWQASLPAERFMVLQYEDLVAAPETQTRRLIAFCGLDWHDACLAFHENKAAVATPSAAQVRRPIYADAKGRWARYGALLDPARRVLEQAGVAL